MRASYLVVLLSVGCGSSVSEGELPSPSTGEFGERDSADNHGAASNSGGAEATGGAHSSSAGSGGTLSGAPDCANADAIEDAALRSALLAASGQSPPWSQEAWKAIADAPPAQIVVDDGKSLQGLECLSRVTTVQLKGGHYLELGALSHFGVASSLELSHDVEVEETAWGSLQSDTFPRFLRFTQSTVTDFTQLPKLAPLRGLELSDSSVLSLDGLSINQIEWLELDSVTGLNAADFASLADLQKLELTGSAVTGKVDLSSLGTLRTVNLDDTTLSTAPVLGTATDPCSTITALRSNLDESTLQTAASTWCDAGWEVTASSGDAGGLIQCGSAVCR